MRKVIWALTFLFGAPAVAIWSFVLLLSLSKPSFAPPYPQILGTTTAVLAPNYELLPEIKQTIVTADARTSIVTNYLKRYNSPLTPFARHLVEIADKYSLDYRLLPAIAQQESNLCKKIPENSYNCWGYGIYGDKVTRFENYSQAIDTVARGLKKNYIDLGLTTPDQIMHKYTPPSVEIGGPWAKGVNQFLAELE